MSLLQALMRCTFTTLLLGLCLQLVTGQDDGRKPLIVTLFPISSAKVNQTTEVRCSISTQLRECVAVKTGLMTSQDTNCYPKPFEVDACICPDNSPRNFYFNICSQKSVAVACWGEIFEDPEICASEISVTPARKKQSYDIKMFSVTK